jgi:hypothetical protein
MPRTCLSKCIIYAGRRLSPMKLDAICIFIGPSISRGRPICSALFFKLIFKNNNFFICIIVYAQTLLTRTSEMRLILNFYTEISIIEGNPQTLPQIRIDDVEATSCLNEPHCNMQIRDMCSVYSWHRWPILVPRYAFLRDLETRQNASSLAARRPGCSGW